MDPTGVRPDARRRLTSALARIVRRPGVVPLVLIVVLAALSWPITSAPARFGLDPSFAAALGYALTHEQRFGTDVLYTYGPLGALGYGSPWFGPLTLLGLVFVGTLHVALVAVIVFGALRLLPVLPAALVAYPATRELRAFLAFEGLLILVTCVALAFLLSRGERGRRLAAPLGGLAVAIGLLGKLNAGVFISAILLVAIVARSRPWWRGALMLGAWAAAWLVPLWLLSGQGPADVPGYIVGSYELISGFSQAMAFDAGPELARFWPAYVAGVILVALLLVRESSALPRTRRLALLVVWGLTAFAFYKTGFVRWHVGYAMALPVVALFAVATRITGPRLFAVSLLAVLVPAVALWGNPGPFVSPVTSLRSLWHQAQLVAQPWTWDAAAEASRAELRAAYALEPEILESLRGQTVHVDPWETAVIVAWPELVWRPLPVFQSFTAYTPWLDDQNARVLRGAAAPTRILRGGPPLGGVPTTPRGATLDGRNRWFESPAAMVETFCRYDEVAASTRWEVLALGARRCAAPEPLGTVTARTGETVQVPVESRPDRLVLVRIRGIEDGLLDRLVTAVYRSPEWWIRLDGTVDFRLVPGTAEDGLLLAVPASIRRSPDFAFGAPIRQLSIAPRGRPPGDATLAYEFLSVPVVGS